MCALSQTGWPECDLQVFHWTGLVHSYKQTSYWQSLLLTKLYRIPKLRAASILSIEDNYFQRYCAVQSDKGLPTFWRTVRLPSSDQWIICWMLLVCMACNFSLKMGAIYSSETTISLYRSTRCHIQAHSSVHCHRCENQIKPCSKLERLLNTLQQTDNRGTCNAVTGHNTHVTCSLLYGGEKIYNLIIQMF